MTGPARTYRGVSADDRRIERRARLLEAGLDVLGAEGMSGLTMTAVCRRAGLTERYFYESFRDREDLLRAMYEAGIDAVNEAGLVALAGAGNDLASRCRAAVGAVVTTLTDDPRRARAYVEAGGHPALRERHAEIAAGYAAFLARQMQSVRGLEHPRHEPALRLASTVLITGFAEAAMGWLAGRLPGTRDDLVEGCVQMCVAVARQIARA